MKCSNYSSLPETLTHFLGTNSLVVGFRSKTVFLPLKLLLVVVSTSAFVSFEHSNTEDRGHQGFLISRAPVMTNTWQS